MWWLYGEVFLLLTVAFVGGALLAQVVLRIALRPLPDQVEVAPEVAMTVTTPAGENR